MSTGLISKYITVVEDNKLGYGAHILLLQLQNYTKEDEKRIIEFLNEHPSTKWEGRDHPRRKRRPENYFNLEIVDFLWMGFGKPVLVSSYRRPLSTFFECLQTAGFHLDKLIEPQPTEDFKRVNPEDWDKIRRRPTFICFRTRKML